MPKKFYVLTRKLQEDYPFIKTDVRSKTNVFCTKCQIAFPLEHAGREDFEAHVRTHRHISHSARNGNPKIQPEKEPDVDDFELDLQAERDRLKIFKYRDDKDELLMRITRRETPKRAGKVSEYLGLGRQGPGLKDRLRIANNLPNIIHQILYKVKY